MTNREAIDLLDDVLDNNNSLTKEEREALSKVLDFFERFSED